MSVQYKVVGFHVAEYPHEQCLKSAVVTTLPSSKGGINGLIVQEATSRLLLIVNFTEFRCDYYDGREVKYNFRMTFCKPDQQKEEKVIGVASLCHETNTVFCRCYSSEDMYIVLETDNHVGKKCTPESIQTKPSRPKISKTSLQLPTSSETSNIHPSSSSSSSSSLSSSSLALARAVPVSSTPASLAISSVHGAPTGTPKTLSAPPPVSRPSPLSTSLQPRTSVTTSPSQVVPPVPSQKPPSVSHSLLTPSQFLSSLDSHTSADTPSQIVPSVPCQKTLSQFPLASGLEQSTPSQPIPSQPIPSQPIPSQSTPSQPIPSQSIPLQPIPSVPLASQSCLPYNSSYNSSCYPSCYPSYNLSHTSSYPSPQTLPVYSAPFNPFLPSSTFANVPSFPPVSTQYLPILSSHLPSHLPSPASLPPPFLSPPPPLTHSSFENSSFSIVYSQSSFLNGQSSIMSYVSGSYV